MFLVRVERCEQARDERCHGGATTLPPVLCSLQAFRGGRAGVTKVAGPNKAQFQLNLSSFTHFNGNFHYEFQVPSCSQKMALKDLRLGVSKRP